MITFANLRTMIEGHNDAALTDLVQQRNPLLPSGAKVASGQASVVGMPPPSIGHIAFQGVVNKVPDDDCKLASRTLALSPRCPSAAIFSVLDSATQSPIHQELPTVLCVGINYSQLATVKIPQPMVDDTGMWARIASAKNLAHKYQVSLMLPAKGNSHLVAANFFPWIARTGWSGIGNVLVEALVLSSYGYAHPAKMLADLNDQIQPEYVVFHGVDNAVPVLALEMLRLMNHLPNSILFCDNLGRTVCKNVVEIR